MSRTAADIRSAFLSYFARQGHTILPSSSLIPREDPTLLFTNAGMVQFKKLFTGQETREYKRATTAQKCLRVGGKHNDLENVGRTARHHTFFEMLGNFSFGDYFKEDAIAFAWEFLTKELALPKDKLYVTVYRDDDEAIGIWKDVANIPGERIFRLGEKDNFWSMGDTGPCGPCSEILIDQGEHVGCGPGCGIGQCDCDRFLEIWNLVFMQYDQLPGGKRVPLPRPSIDTGMGLERVAAVVQGVYSNFDNDLFSGLIEYAADLCGKKYRADDDTDTALRVIADHSRAIAFLTCEGVLPSNEGRGYVLRRLVRRALRFGRLIGLAEPFLYRTVAEVARRMGDAYPEVASETDFTTRVVREEEMRFGVTLETGLNMLQEEIERLVAEQGTTISGDFAFKLHDTYGFPLDIVTDVAGKAGIGVDEEGYRNSMAKQKAMARAAWKGSGEAGLGSRFQELLDEGLTTRFVGYDALTATSRVAALLTEEGEPVEKLASGQGGYVVFSTTPFYGESGGQAGDRGEFDTPTGKGEVVETVKPGTDLTVSKIFVSDGEILLDQEASCLVNGELRAASARNHTVTHLLHAALRRVLGPHVKQAGSLVTPERLRFDFAHVSALTPEELSAVADDVNAAILENHAVTRSFMSRDEAVAAGAMALFGEKYGERVCVVDVPGVSTELCGGTHLAATGQAGCFVILSEQGVAAGVRRIEAATGFNAIAFFEAQRRELDETAALLRARPGELPERVKALSGQVKSLTKERDQATAKLASCQGGDILSQASDIGGAKVLAVKVQAADVKALREAADDLRSKIPSGVFCLGAAVDNGAKAALLVAVTKDLHGKLTAGEVIKAIASKVGGSGGGRPDMAQAGGTDVSGLDAALAAFTALVSEKLSA